MNLYGVTISIDSLYYEIEAENQDDAIYSAFNLANDELGREQVPELDCNECYLIDGEEEEEE